MPTLRPAIFVFLVAFAFTASTSVGQTETSTVAEPKLPVIDFKACGSGDFAAHFQGRISRQQRMYSTWREGRASVGTLRRGNPYMLVGGVNIIREPDRAVVRNVISQAQFLKPGDAVLGYGYDADGATEFWAHGIWFREDDEHVSAMGVACGFADKTMCTIEITKRGVKDWWVQVKTNSGLKGWLLGATMNGDKVWFSGNFNQMCRD